MTFIQAILHSVFHPHADEGVTIDAEVENAVFDLKQSTRANIATTKLLDSLLERSAKN